MTFKSSYWKQERLSLFHSFVTFEVWKFEIDLFQLTETEEWNFAAKARFGYHKQRLFANDFCEPRGRYCFSSPWPGEVVHEPMLLFVTEWGLSKDH